MCPQEYLEAALALPLLRLLSVHVTKKLKSSLYPSSNVAGLRRLVIGMRWPEAQTLTRILQTHSGTLEYLEVHCASRSMKAQTDYFVPNIHEILKECRFAKLKEILLERHVGIRNVLFLFVNQNICTDNVVVVVFKIQALCFKMQ